MARDSRADAGGWSGRGRGIRTPDILLPKQARYQTALYPAVERRPPRTGPRQPGAYCPGMPWQCQREPSTRAGSFVKSTQRAERCTAWRCHSLQKRAPKRPSLLHADRAFRSAATAATHCRLLIRRNAACGLRRRLATTAHCALGLGRTQTCDQRRYRCVDRRIQLRDTRLQTFANIADGVDRARLHGFRHRLRAHARLLRAIGRATRRPTSPFAGHCCQTQAGQPQVTRTRFERGLAGFRTCHCLCSVAWGRRTRLRTPRACAAPTEQTH